MTAEQNAENIPGRQTLDLFLNQITSYSADFEQTLYDEYGGVLEKSNGTLALLKPGKFYWEYIDPYRQKIISNGKILWIFDEDLAQVTINEVKLSETDSPLALLVNGSGIDKAYQVEALPRDDDLIWLALLPKAQDAQYHRVEIGINENDVVRMRLQDNLNQLTDVEFVNANKETPIDPHIFEFEIPADVDIISGLSE